MVAAVVVLTLDDGRTEEVALEQSDTVGISLFEDRNDIVAARIPEGVTMIGDGAFEDCSSLVSVVIPESVTTIGRRAFDGCSSLVSVVIPDGVTTIGRYAFTGCSSLVSVTLSQGLTAIRAGAFEGCSSFASVTIPESVTTIEWSAFANCSSLTRVSIVNPTAQIRPTSFFGCDSIDRVDIHDNVTVLFDPGVSKKIREIYQEQPAWWHVFPDCPAANIRWPTSVRERYEAGFVDRATAISIMAALTGRGQRNSNLPRLPMEMVRNVAGLRAGDFAV